MSRKDFELIARTIKDAPVNHDCRREMAIEFARALRSTNSQFDASRFIKACGVEC